MPIQRKIISEIFSVVQLIQICRLPVWQNEIVCTHEILLKYIFQGHSSLVDIANFDKVQIVSLWSRFGEPSFYFSEQKRVPEVTAVRPNGWSNKMGSSVYIPLATNMPFGFQRKVWRWSSNTPMTIQHYWNIVCVLHIHRVIEHIKT